MKRTKTRQHSGLLSPWVDAMRVKRVSLHIPPASKILDIGCGPGLLLPYLQTPKLYVGVDMDPELIAENQAEFHPHRFHCFDVCGSVFPFQNEEFDCVVCAAFLEHVDNPKIMFTEIRRVLKPNGIVIATTPSKMGGGVHEVLSHIRLLSHDAAEEHKGFLSLKSLKLKLEGTGLRVKFFESFQMGLNQLFILVRGEDRE